MNIYHAILKEFKFKWEKKHPNKTFAVLPMHYRRVKELLTPVEGFPALEANEVIRRIDVYLNNKFYDVCQHSLNAFVKNFDLFQPPPEKPKLTAFVSCRKCGEILRRENIPAHHCSIIGDGLRKEKEAILLGDAVKQIIQKV